MQIAKMAPIVTTARIEEMRAFYQKHLGFEVTFDGAGYLGMKAAGDGGAEVSFMLPEGDEEPSFGGGGLTFCLEVADVDAEHERLRAEGLEDVRPLQDNPWGDRSFVVSDPAGVAIYLFAPIEPAAEYKEHWKE